MGAADRLANSALAFQRWVLNGTDTGEIAARQALIHLTELFAAALALPSALEGADLSEIEVADDEWRRVFESARRLPMQHYGEVFDPLALPPVGPGVGDLADDIADIYRDVVGALRAYQSGDHVGAARQWRFTFWCHWGRHAAGAARALYAWIEANYAWLENESK